MSIFARTRFDTRSDILLADQVFPQSLRARRRPRLPLVEFRREAGFGSHAEYYIEEEIPLNAHLIRLSHEASIFIVREKKAGLSSAV